MSKAKEIRCPNCEQKCFWSEENKYRPFCSERCKLIDFGDWANENNRIPENLVENKGDFIESRAQLFEFNPKED